MPERPMDLEAIERACPELSTVESMAIKALIAEVRVLQRSEKTLNGLFKDAIAEIDSLRSRIAELEAARLAYASEFPLNEYSLPNVGSIHENIRTLKKENHSLRSRLESHHQGDQ